MEYQGRVGRWVDGFGISAYISSTSDVLGSSYESHAIVADSRVELV